MPHRRFPLHVPRSYLPCRRVVHLTGALVAALLLCEAAHADWPADGVVLCSACRARGSLIAPDGTGGAFAAWTDARNGPGSNDDIFLQRVTASGAIAPGWPADGFPVCLALGVQGLEDVHSIAPDGLGGVIVAWRDYRNDTPGGTSADIYAQRVLASGSLAPGWPVDGAAVARTLNHQELPVVLADGNGGAFITWEEGYAPDPNIYLQYLAPAGSVMPGWPANGLAVCTAAGFQGFPRLAPDGSGGVFVAWGDLRDGLVASYAQRVTAAAGTAAGWPANGRRIVLGPYLQDLVSDGVGGAFLFGATPAPLYFADCYLQRFTGSGDIAAGWPPDGAPVCLAPDERVGLRMEADGSGGALLVWSDYRDHSDDDVYAMRMRSDGTRDPRWPVNGLPVTDNTALDDFTDLAADGQGGAYLCWDQYSFATGNLVMVQHLTGAGSVTPGWPAGGLVVPTMVGSPHPHIVADGVGGAIVAWEDYYEHARALRIAPDVPTAVAVSLVRTEAEPGLVRLTWFAAEGASLLAGVERRTETSDWERLASVSPDGTGQIVYVDRTVTPGTRYAYRLSYPDEAGVAYTSETWVTTPALRFALRGLTPNPSAGDPVVAFSLASGEPASLELFDLHGRLVLSREVGALGAGSHEVPVGARGRLPAGVYAVRLRQGERVAMARAVIIR